MDQPMTADGRAYGRPPATPDEDLVRCGPGTLGGELLRRYWQPVALSADVTSRPQQVKILGEDLILFRDHSGKAGLLYPRCMHRGTSLLYGKVEESGIRCCYHGWLFSPEGHLLETPCEPNSPVRKSVRQPWYPVLEKFGIVFTYMGPPERQPLFPVFSIEENLGEDEELVVARTTYGANGPHPKVAARTDYNWWQMFDNWMDPFHVVVLHNMINGVQFSENLGILPDVRFEQLSDGVISIQKRRLPDGAVHQRVSQVLMPNMNGTPGITDEDLGPANLGWTVPTDDTNFVQYHLVRVRKGENQFRTFDLVGMLSDDWGPKHGKPFLEWSLEDHQDWQTDYAAQKGQGDISLHSEEHLVAGDKGMGMMRRLFRQQAAKVARGEDPVGVAFDQPYRVELVAGNALLDAETGRCIAGYAART
ncbi:MAG TPA: Rieske 2Fe-2S domain-containing protein [Phenylobacterium sp.]|uniref:Rieske 2Fe-2S domain-containing protein n=1 Tax=Phenylobacterium sp. TaxID=1871053 RepID=UPI002B4A228B|nr:Rieske 2Fe-2S domain-containing protein [Phenylobacterium sp.]HKR89666.1 Rieske 2Fe-2S domain-containing protein [Phenylobacterium sp.]HKT54920.1 Rieske 2Fe-2S domain-containing protein [Caulobacteraceae bacterium]